MLTGKLNVEIINNEKLSEAIFSMWIAADQIAGTAKPGQFVSLYTKDGGHLLPRPISICEIDPGGGRIRLVYRAVGEGTKEFSQYQPKDKIAILGPLGNGFHFEGNKALIIGGGIGIPPMLELSKQLNCEKSIVLGYRDITFMEEEFRAYGQVYVATEDGNQGTKGNVLDAIREHALEADIIYACGPIPMLRGIKEYARENHIQAQLSLEERMACGIGACLACVCKTKNIDHHTNVHNRRICKEGPVFYANEVEI